MQVQQKDEYSGSIIAVVSDLSGVGVDEIKGPSRTRRVLQARYCAGYLMRTLKAGSVFVQQAGNPKPTSPQGGMPVASIADALGARDHTTIISGVRYFADRLARESYRKERQLYHKARIKLQLRGFC